MPPTAEDHYRSLPPADQAVVLRMRQTLQKDGYEALDDHEARSTRQRFQRTLSDDKGQSPLQRQLALELLSRRVPTHQWVRFAATAEPGGPHVTGLTRTVKHMNDQTAPPATPARPSGLVPAEQSTARIFGLSPLEMEAMGQEAVRERIADGRALAKGPATPKTSKPAKRTESLGLGG